MDLCPSRKRLERLETIATEWDRLGPRYLFRGRSTDSSVTCSQHSFQHTFPHGYGHWTCRWSDPTAAGATLQPLERPYSRWSTGVAAAWHSMAPNSAITSFFTRSPVWSQASVTGQADGGAVRRHGTGLTGLAMPVEKLSQCHKTKGSSVRKEEHQS